jgi:hypothetical protein
MSQPAETDDPTEIIKKTSEKQVAVVKFGGFVPVFHLVWK